VVRPQYLHLPDEVWVLSERVAGIGCAGALTPAPPYQEPISIQQIKEIVPAYGYGVPCKFFCKHVVQLARADTGHLPPYFLNQFNDNAVAQRVAFFCPLLFVPGLSCFAKQPAYC
jgi:hypothetical protein